LDLRNILRDDSKELLESLLNIQRFPSDTKQFKEDIKKSQPEIQKEYDEISRNIISRIENFAR